MIGPSEPRSFVQRINNTRHLRMMDDFRRNRGFSEREAMFSLQGLQKLQKGKASDGTFAWLIRPPVSNSSEALEQVNQITDKVKSIAQSSSVGHVAVGDWIALLGTLKATQKLDEKSRFHITPLDKNFYTNVAIQEHYLPNSISIALPSPFKEPPPDPSLAYAPSVYTALLDPINYKKSWHKFLEKHPEHQAIVKSHLKDCERFNLVNEQPKYRDDAGFRASEVAVNKVRSGISALPARYETIFRQANQDVKR